MNFDSRTDKRSKRATESLIAEGAIMEGDEVLNADQEGNIVETPVIEDPVVETPAIEDPKVEEPVVSEPIVEEPVVEETIVEEPKAEEPKQEEPAETTEQVMNNFNQFLEGGATEAEFAQFATKYPNLKTNFRSALKNKFKTEGKARFFAKYSAMGNEDLEIAVKSGDVVVWSEKYNLLPAEKRASFEQYSKEKNASDLETEWPAKAVSFDDILQEQMTIYSSNLREEYNNILSNPRIATTRQQLVDKAGEIEEKNIELENIAEKVKAELGSSLPWAINAVIRDEKNSLLQEKRILLAEQGALNAQLSDMKSDIETELKMIQYEDADKRQAYENALKIWQTNKDQMTEVQKAEFEAENKRLAEERAFNTSIALLNHKAKLEEASDIRKSKLWQISDTRKAKLAQQEWKWVERQDGIYFEKKDGTREKVADKMNIPGVNEKVSFDDGIPYVEVTDINNNPIWFSPSNTNLTWSEVALLNAPDGTRIPTRLNKEELSPNNPGGKECGEYVNDIMSRSVGQKIGSKWQDKLNYANEDAWGIWSVAVWQVDPNNKEMSKYGHAGIIVWEWIKDWIEQWVIKSSNIEWVWVVSERLVPKSVISGYRSTNAIWKTQTFDRAQEKFMKTVDIDKFWTSKELWVRAKELWLTPKDVYNYKSQNFDAKQDARDALEQLDIMMKAGDGDWFSDALWYTEGRWRIFWWSWREITTDAEWNRVITFPPWSQAAAFKAQFDKFVSWETLGNLWLMTWTLTNKDIDILKNAKTSLSLELSEKDFKEELARIRWALNRTINSNFIPQEDVIYTAPDGLNYSKETMQEYINKKLNTPIDQWWRTNDDAKDFIELNNLNSKLQ